MRLIDKDELTRRLNTGMNIIEMMQTVMDMPTIEDRKWIPCSERLPEPRIDVWVCSDLGQMVAYYEENVETWYGRNYLELLVTAWMPLPEPYQTEEKK